MAITTFTIPRSIAASTLDVVERAGASAVEAFVLWGGVVDESRFVYTSVLIPEQVAHQTADGLLVTVEGQALFEANKAFYRRGEILGAQVHSHPTEAYHSTTDDCFSLVTLAGALSVVIPNFGRDRFDGIRDWAFYRLVRGSEWSPLTADDHIELVADEDSI